MDYEKKYNEAIKRAKQHCADYVVETIFQLKESEDKKPNGAIVMEDFNEGNGFYKVNLAYLNKEQVEEIEELVKKWNPEFAESEDERIRKEIIDCIQYMKNNYCIPSRYTSKQYDTWIDWLEKQGEHADFRNKIQIGDKVTRNKDGVLVNLSQLKRVAKPAEKQGEQQDTSIQINPSEYINDMGGNGCYLKSTDKIEPKFKESD